ncbi:MAG: glycerol-3-phosphate dehydrogenase [Epulopiscium sp. Nuni2H_MBin001]|nr:MAG: glycerol-3-phosphate dehydrogenase [Epulopiscium sp. Nuni2H_MBin001]
MKKITILGAGGWGLALGLLLNEKDCEVTVWSYSEKETQQILMYQENKRCLPGIKIPLEMKITSCMEEALEEAEIVVFAIPSKAIRQMAKSIKPYISEEAIIVNVSKGIEETTLLRLSEVISQELNNSVVVLSGPSHAEEVVRHSPTSVVVASTNDSATQEIAEVFSTPYFRVYTNDDVIGVELGGALKNVIALAAGAIEGLGFGDNTKAALITRGIAEISRLGVAMGGKISTLNGLSGVGDLIGTCTSGHSRNRRAGELIALGYTLDDTISRVNMVVEGIPATRAAYQLKDKYDIEMPITEAIYQALFEDRNVKDAITDLMLRARKTEDY